jgi:hypothetical protein
MAEKKCPYCSSQSFFVKAPQDEYEIFEFDLKGGEIIANPENLETARPDVGEDTETFCSRCSWHGKFKTLKTTG